MSKLHASSTHLVLIPSYNPGAKVDTTVRNARAQWNPVWSSSTAAPTAAPNGCRRWPSATRGCA